MVIATESVVDLEALGFLWMTKSKALFRTVSGLSQTRSHTSVSNALKRPSATERSRPTTTKGAVASPVGRL